MAIDIAANLGSAGTSEVALPLFAREHLHAGIGALAGSLVATRRNRARRPAVAAGLVFLAQVPLTTSYGMFPVSVALAGLVARRYGPGAFFILAAATLAATLAWALSRQAFRDFGMRPAAEPSAQPVSAGRAAAAP